MRAIAVSATAAAMLAACDGGDGTGFEGDAPPGPLPPGPFAPNFSEIQANVFTPTCATVGCHTGAGAPQGLMLDAANSYGLLVDVASSEVPSILRVAPGDPDNSYLVQKLEGSASAGARMPFGRPALPQATIDVIRQWITDGAMDDRPSSTAAIRVMSISPVPGDEQDSAPDKIVAMFDRELDVSTVHSATFILEGSGGDGTFADGNERQIAAAAITTSANATSATFDLGGVVLIDDSYRVRLLGSGPSMILDLDANALDGEFGGAFSSGDGSEGGDFAAVFTVK
jgi:hypothetical protein